MHVTWSNSGSKKIHQYLTGEHGQRVGVLIAVAEKDDDFVSVGWSLCSKRDRFDRVRGLEIAEGRAEKIGHWGDVPPSLEKYDLNGFQERAAKYFKRPVYRVRTVEDPLSPGLTD